MFPYVRKRKLHPHRQFLVNRTRARFLFAVVCGWACHEYFVISVNTGASSLVFSSCNVFLESNTKRLKNSSNWSGKIHVCTIGVAWGVVVVGRCSSYGGCSVGDDGVVVVVGVVVVGVAVLRRGVADTACVRSWSQKGITELRLRLNKETWLN